VRIAKSRQINAALAWLVIAPAFLSLTASAVCGETLVLAAADSRPTAFLVDGKPTGMLVDLVTEAYRRAGQSVEIKLMPGRGASERPRQGRLMAFSRASSCRSANSFSPFRKKP